MPHRSARTHRSERVADIVASSIAASGGVARASDADVSDPDGARSIVDDALEAFGSVDIVIHAAGIVPYASLEDTSFKDFFDALAVHIGGGFNLAKFVLALARRLRQWRS